MRRQALLDNRRRAVAVTELAVCLPVLVLIVLGSFELCSMFHLKQSLSIASYEAARISLHPQATSAIAQDQAELVLQSRRVVNYSIEVSPDVSTCPVGTFIAVTSTADCGANSFLGSPFYSGRQISSTVEMMKEF